MPEVFYRLLSHSLRPLLTVDAPVANAILSGCVSETDWLSESRMNAIGSSTIHSTLLPPSIAAQQKNLYGRQLLPIRKIFSVHANA